MNTNENLVELSREEYTKLKSDSALLVLREAEVVERVADYNALCVSLREANAQINSLRAQKQVNPLEELLQTSIMQVLNGILTSDMFENRINEELEKAIDRFREGKEFEQQISSAIKDYLENTNIEVDEYVEAAIKEALDVVQIRFQGH